MALVKPGSTVTELEGKEGGTVFRKDICGQHAQSLPRSIKHETPLQRKQRRAFRGAITYCLKTALTEENTKLWWIYSYNHPKTNKKGEVIYLTPFTACLRINTIRGRNDLDLVPTPPD